MESKYQQIHVVMNNAEKTLENKLYGSLYESLGIRRDSRMRVLNWDIFGSCPYFSNSFYKKTKPINLKGVVNLFVDQEKACGRLKDILSTPFVMNISLVTFELERNLNHKHGKWIRSAINLLPRVTNKLHFKGYFLNRNCFRKIIQVGRHIGNIRFTECDINLSGLKLSETLHYSIESISIWFNDNNKSESSEERYLVCKDLLEAMPMTDLIASLEIFKTNSEQIIEELQYFSKYLLFQNLSICAM
ncbi:unnamed protein product [Moneuplotes crassus]|uniref:Uncharacterized protein n=1 Tax=Euplotes crassus TaxID=5936 RepID=A0AAD2D4U5_EUPCR|nr:unnamed protein product [Moneuplotes crassus]